LGRFFKAIKYSSIGLFFAGIVFVIQGCTVEREGALGILLLLLLQFCTPMEIEEGVTFNVYAVNAADFNGNADKLYQIDPTNGSQLGIITLNLPGETVNRGNALATNPLTNVLFGVLDVLDCSRRLVTINPNTGATTNVGNTGARLAALAFDTSGTLYAVSGSSLMGGDCTHPVRTLFEVDQTNGQLTALCALPFTGADRGDALTFNPIDDLLYFSISIGNLSPPTLHTIDDTSGANCSVTAIPLTGGAISATGSRVTGLVFNPLTGIFLANTGTNLFSLTPGGVDTLLGPLLAGNENIRQMAFVKQ